MPNTPVQGLPYPALSDPANGPVAFQNLATALEDYKTLVRCTSTTRPGHVEGRTIYETDTDRIMVSDGANWQQFASRKDPRGYLGSWADAGPYSPGDTSTVPTAAITIAANDLRVLRIAHDSIGKCNGVAGTGHNIRVMRSVNGGAYAQVGAPLYVVYPSSAIESTNSLEVWDTPPAGSITYRLNALAYGGHGNVWANCRITIYDEGGQ